MRALIICLWLFTVMQHEIHLYTILTGTIAVLLSWHFSKTFAIIIITSAALMHWYDWYYVPSALFFLTLFVTIFMLPGGNSKAHRHNNPGLFYDIGSF